MADVRLESRHERPICAAELLHDGDAVLFFHDLSVKR
jgi:uncharacterized Zn ribbon protein